jgi:endonuclease/exonuclease/phosphatase family metal-dependent hydrolase
MDKKIIFYLFFLILCIIIFYKKDTIKIITVNIGYYLIAGFANDGIEQMEKRCRDILNILVSYNPDVICTQEDLLVTKNFTPIFENIYKEYGYEIINYCQSHIKKITPTELGKTKLGNVIYGKINLKNIKKISNIDNLDYNQKGCHTKPRCATGIIINNYKLINTHLCGGRFDDKYAMNNKIPKDTKEKQMQNILYQKPDIILGDFNSSYQNDNTNNKVWKEGALNILFKADYKTAIKDYLKKETSFRSKKVLDWIFYKHNINLIDSKIIKLYNDNQLLTDHHAVYAEIY